MNRGSYCPIWRSNARESRAAASKALATAGLINMGSTQRVQVAEARLPYLAMSRSVGA
jgi:hypothetical protein